MTIEKFEIYSEKKKLHGRKYLANVEKRKLS